ncbi:hypothetical protein JOQ06_028558 [Pogonophryne albipinna]|uniref:Integrase zinc-binding domain-containing protein n=1 Tax=Pogonophryne albipinna TaxID=1090488 RepID=A0AAD6B927_9TELE|nr:hypothetical protein JOQ06_028558 [Pogonophryne albipinna]
MDPNVVCEILIYKTKGKYPDGASRSQQNVIRRRSMKYDTKGGDLFLKGKSQKIKVACGSEEAGKVFIDFHASPTVCTLWPKKPRDAISKRFFWPGMCKDIDQWVAQCTVCQAGAIVIKQEVEYTPIKVDGSVEDVVGQESLTEEILHLEDTLKEARENVTRAQEKTRQRLKSASGKTVFKVGEKVWRQNKRSQQRKGGKTCSSCTTTSILTSTTCHRTCISCTTSILTSTTCHSYTHPVVEDAWAGTGSHVLVSKIGPYKMYYWDIRQIRPNMELESEVINAYLAVKVKDFNQENPRGQRATFIDTFEMTTIWNNGTSRLKQPDGTSCGVFALKFPESILRSEEDISFATTTQAIEEHRRNIATTLIQQIDDLSALCCYCAAQRNDYTYWVTIILTYNHVNYRFVITETTKIPCYHYGMNSKY